MGAVSRSRQEPGEPLAGISGASDPGGGEQVAHDPIEGRHRLLALGGRVFVIGLQPEQLDLLLSGLRIFDPPRAGQPSMCITVSAVPVIEYWMQSVAPGGALAGTKSVAWDENTILPHG